MTRFFKGALLLVVVIFLLSACNVNIEEEQKATNDKVADVLNGSAKKTNSKVNAISFYLPEGFAVKEKSPNNVILNNGSLQYILFYNPQEGPDSEIVYNSTISNSGKYQYKKNYKKDGEFGFLLIKDAEGKLQEITVGIGGVKMTAEVKAKNMKEEAGIMMQIVKSVTMK
jgi:hypothetical protein